MKPLVFTDFSWLKYLKEKIEKCTECDDAELYNCVCFCSLSYMYARCRSADSEAAVAPLQSPLPLPADKQTQSA